MSIEVRPVYEFEGPLGWYEASGHVDKAAFCAALLEAQGEVCDVADVRHVYSRRWPMAVDGEQVWTGSYDYPKGQGAKPVTIVDASRCSVASPEVPA